MDFIRNGSCKRSWRSIREKNFTYGPVAGMLLTGICISQDIFVFSFRPWLSGIKLREGRRQNWEKPLIRIYFIYYCSHLLFDLAKLAEFAGLAEPAEPLYLWLVIASRYEIDRESRENLPESGPPGIRISWIGDEERKRRRREKDRISIFAGSRGSLWIDAIRIL